MDTNFFNILEKARSQVNDCTAGILAYIDDDEQRAKYLKDMEDVLTGLVSCEHKVAVTRQAVKEATNRALDESTEQIGVSLFDDLVEESISELEQDSPLEQAVAEATSLQLFRKQVEEFNAKEDEDSGEEELVAVQVGPSFIDPISKKKMTDPVRNKKCQHVYDRASVTSMISKTLLV
ncbi:E3 SUMO-protein ligase NSE2-like [Eriocheir sinensis]|uniref:E3 SUMO-protein ligase NSE2-like n=1 Tax=Eriocheir sinensis TaxID=95602 RepID=UPI0021C5BACF|nr:E3 SUMO-protein ligase NSE2-like [Eriocheir sinensis]